MKSILRAIDIGEFWKIGAAMLGTMFLLSLIGAIPVIDRLAILFLCAVSYAFGYFTKGFELRREIDLSLTGIFLGSITQTLVFPMGLFRATDFIICITAVTTAVAAWNAESEERKSQLFAISSLSSVSLIVTNILGWAFLTPMFLRLPQERLMMQQPSSPGKYQ